MAAERVTVLLAALLLGAGLAACGGEGGPTSTAVSQTEESSFEPRRHEDSGGGGAKLRSEGASGEILAFGEEADAGEFKRAAASLHSFLDAVAAGRWSAACDQMAGWVVEGFEQLAEKDEEADGCGAMLARFSGAGAGRSPAAEARRADVISVRVDGNRAFAVYRGRNGRLLAIEMRREGDSWKVAGLRGRPVARKR